MDKTLEELTIAAILNNYAYPKGFVMKLRSIVQVFIVSFSFALGGCFDDSPAGGTIGVSSNAGGSSSGSAVGDLDELDSILGGTKWETACFLSNSEDDGSTTYVKYGLEFSGSALEFEEFIFEYGNSNFTCDGEYLERSRAKWSVLEANFFSTSFAIAVELDTQNGPKDDWVPNEGLAPVYQILFSTSDNPDSISVGLPWDNRSFYVDYSRIDTSF